MNLSKKIISTIEAEELHLCPKCLKFKKSNAFNKHYWCKECKKYNDELKFIDNVSVGGK